MVLMSAMSSLPTPVARCTMATRSRRCLPTNSTAHGDSDEAEYLGLVDPQSAAGGGLFDRSAGAGLGELRQACGDPVAERRHPRDLGGRVAIRSGAGRAGIAGHQDR